MNLTYLNNGFICKTLQAPFVLESDCDDESDLRENIINYFEPPVLHDCSLLLTNRRLAHGDYGLAQPVIPYA